MLPTGPFRAAPAGAKVAPTLEQARENRRGLARDIDRRKRELATHLEAVFPDFEVSVRAAFKIRDDVPKQRHRDAEAALAAAGVASEPCQCLQWEEWAATVLGSHGTANYPASLDPTAKRDLVLGVLGKAERERADASSIGRNAMEVTRAAQVDASEARKAERSARGRLQEAQALLRRCYCGRPDPDPEYPADRDKYLGRS
jgi:hypothetical protein